MFSVYISVSELAYKWSEKGKVDFSFSRAKILNYEHKFIY
jgi:hypothetical protein